MKKIFILLISIGLFSCNANNTKTRAGSKTNDVLVFSNDTISWINNFKEFRGAVYNKDIGKVKVFVSFPVANFKNNPIGNGLYINLGNEDYQYLDGSKPISEEDFETLYSTIFPEQFIKSILKIKSEALFKTGNNETPFITIDKSRYKIYATFEQDKNILELNLYSEKPIETEETVEDKAEFSAIYTFKIAADGKMKFIKLDFAG